MTTNANSNPSCPEKTNGDILAYAYRKPNGEISFVKIGILVAIAAYTFVYNPMFLLFLFEVFIIMYAFLMFWKIGNSLLLN